MAEGLSIGNLTHKEFHYHEKFVDGLIEPGGGNRWGCPSYSLLQLVVRLCIVELNSADTAYRMEVS